MNRLTRYVVLTITVPVLAFAFPEHANGQLRDSIAVEGDTVSLEVVARDDSLLKALGFETYGDFYYAGWLEPIGKVKEQVAFAFAKSSDELDLPAVALSPGGILRIRCVPRWSRGGPENNFDVAVLTESVLTADAQGDVRGVGRLDQTRLAPSNDWTVTPGQTGAYLPQDQEQEFYANFLASDTLAVRLTDAAGDRQTYVFMLHGRDSITTRTRLGLCRPSP